MDYVKWLLIAAMTVAMSTACDEQPASEQTTSASKGAPSWEFGEWDRNDDELVTENELADGFEALTVDWDEDGDAQISPAEMSDGLFHFWDTDDDGRLEVSEFEEGAEVWFGDRWSYAGFEDIDTDGDKELTLEEYHVGVDDMRVYDEVDENDDDKLTPGELAAAYRTYWDADGDGDIEPVEWANRTLAPGTVHWDVGAWDANDDNVVTENELLDGFEGLTVDWDADGDATISKVEMSSGLFSLWDTDEDGALEKSEFEEGAERWFGDTWDYAGFEDLDADGDKELTLEEYDSVVDDIAIYDDLDEDDDDNVSVGELAEGYERFWDADGDGSLEAVEWAELG